MVAQGAAYLAYDLSQPTPKPHLTVRLDGEGVGPVLITRATDGLTLARCVPDADPLADIDAKALVPAISATTQRLSDLIARRNDPPILHAMREIEGPRCRIEVDAGTQVRLTAVLGREGDVRRLSAVSDADARGSSCRCLGDPLATCLGRVT